ncbi:MAG: DnaJ domain-containing protein [Rhodoglobus sp.]
MSESPLFPSPYEVLGVAASVTERELRRAFRRALRETHPDTGGDPRRFDAVQQAWDQVGTAQKRAAYDAGLGRSFVPSETFTAQAARPRQDTRPKARSYGHPGGWRREKFLEQLREWVGRGVEIPNPYDPALIAAAPREIQRTLADALAEESTARTLSALGIGFTVWHDVATGVPESKIDHIVLGPSGLFAMISEDFGGSVRIRKGELIGEAVTGERPMYQLAARAKILSRQWRIRFSALVIVLPDDALDQAMIVLGTARGVVTLAVRQSHLAQLLRRGVSGTPIMGGTELFEVRTRVSAGVRFL